MPARHLRQFERLLHAAIVESRKFAVTAALGPPGRLLEMNLRPRLILVTFALAAAIAIQPSRAVALPQARDADDVAARRAVADSLFAAAKYPAAREAYSEVVAAWPDSLAVAYRLAQTLVVTGRPRESLALFRQVIAAGYRKTSALYYMAIAQGDMGAMAAAYATLDTMMAAGFRNKYGLLTDSMLVTLRSDERWPAFISEVWGTAEMPEVSQPLRFVEQRDGVEISMRDGTKLAATLMMPEGEGTFPTVLVRTPYGRVFEWGNRVHWAARGYVLVAQDVRGRGDSEGNFDPWMNERTDGFDTIDWITRQPWSNGRVGMIGASYAAQVQWLAAAERHPALDAIIPIVSGTDPFYDTPWDHGILKLGLLGWAFDVTYPDSSPTEGSWRDATVAPLEDADEMVTGSDLAIWNRWVARDRPEDWASASFLDQLAADPEGEDVPAVFHVSGWWDVESIATQRNWSRLAAAGKRDQWLLYGPWQHDNFYEHPPLSRGDVEFGDAARIAFLAEWTRFFDHWLKHRPVGLDTLPRVRAFMIGANRWACGDAWPLPGAGKRVFHLAGNAGRPGEAGSLAGAAPASTPAASFRTDPADILLHEDPTFAEDTHYPVGAVNRDDQLAWISEPFSESVSVVGPAELDITVTTDAPDIDLYALLVSVDPDGTARALAQPGKMRASLGTRERRPAGTPVQLTLPMFPVGYRLPAGSRLGLVLRADWFPRFAPIAAEGDAPHTVRATIGGSTTTTPRLSVYMLDDD